MAVIETTTTSLVIRPEHIPAEMVAVSYRYYLGPDGTPGLWKYRFHLTERSAKIAYGKYGRAYDSHLISEYGWKVIDDTARKHGIWLW